MPSFQFTPQPVQQITFTSTSTPITLLGPVQGPQGPQGPQGDPGSDAPSDHTLLSNIGTNTHAQIDTHIANTSNPHIVTKAQVGLSNVPNTDFTADVAANTAKISFDAVSSARLANTSGTNTGDQDLSGYSLTSHNHTGVYAPVLGADDNYVTDAEKVVIGNTSGTNTGDNATNSQYSGLAASKQDTLVSGTNIKTINSTSLLGSGDIAISTTDATKLPLAGGTMSGTINTQDLLPATTYTYTLGDSSHYYSNAYTTRQYFNSTAYLDGGTAGAVGITGNVGIGTTTGINSKLTFAADTTAAGGILFGTDTNLYRSAANTLKTDDSLVIPRLDSLSIPTLTNTSYTMPNASSGQYPAFSPVPKYLWHDLLAYQLWWGTPTHETYNGTWNSATLNKALFANKENQAVTVIDGTTSTAARWTWNSNNIAFSFAHWWTLGITYTPTTSSKDILVESSTDGSVWTTRHTTTANTANAQPVWLYVTDWAGATYIRLTITVTNSQPLAMSSIKALSARWGNQGGGSENNLPYTWDNDGRITVGTGTGGIAGTTNYSNGALNVGLSTATTAAQGIYFGTDTNLYRSAANTLKTDDSLMVAGSVTVADRLYLNATAYLDGGTAGAVGITGNVGIGTTTPAHYLDVSKTVNSRTAYGINSTMTASTLQSDVASTGNDETFTNSHYAWKFVASAAHTVGSISVRLKKVGTVTNTTDTIQLKIFSDNAGTPDALLLTTDSMRMGTLTTSYVEYLFGGELTLVNGTTYWIAVRKSAAVTGGGSIAIDRNGTALTTCNTATPVSGDWTVNAGLGRYTVYGRSPIGIRGISTNYFGVYGISTNNIGVYGSSTNWVGVYGSSTNSYGVQGSSTNWVGVYGSSTNNVGVYGTSTNSFGVNGNSTNSYGAVLTQSGTLTAANSSNAVLVRRNGVTNSTGSLNYSGNVLQITDAPTGTGTVSGALISGLLSVASDGSGTTERIRFDPRVANGASAVAHMLDTGNALSTAGALLLDVRNNGVSKHAVDLNGNIIEKVPTTPASATAAGVQGTICWDADYVYVCVATNTWKRSALGSW
jgi:hypothetical protein